MRKDMMRQLRTAAPLDTGPAADEQESKLRRAVHRAHEMIEDHALSSSALAWLASLPKTLYPSHLVERYPRVCNCMAVLWQEPKLMISYFEDLLIEDRGVQQGFPSAIASEIARLKEHFHLNLGFAETAACAST
jgi:hypothetical protein